MKMVKSLLLGSAAGLVAVTAGQAADLPVKAKPVEYVKVCSLYGAGFYYMPGTDMCIKIGGWVRVEATWGNDNGSMTWGPYAGQENIRTTSNFVTRSAVTSRRMLVSRPLTARRAPISTSAFNDTPSSAKSRRPRHVQLEPRLPAVGRHHGRSDAVVLRLLQRAGRRLHAPRSADRRHRRRRHVGCRLHRAARQRPVGDALCRNSAAIPRLSVSGPVHAVAWRDRRIAWSTTAAAWLRQRSSTAHCSGRSTRSRLRRQSGARHRRQSPRRPDLGQRAGHGRAASGQCELLLRDCRQR